MPFKRDKLGRLIYVSFPNSIGNQKIEKILEQAQPTQNIDMIMEG